MCVCEQQQLWEERLHPRQKPPRNRNDGVFECLRITNRNKMLKTSDYQCVEQRSFYSISLCMQSWNTFVLVTRCLINVKMSAYMYCSCMYMLQFVQKRLAPKLIIKASLVHSQYHWLAQNKSVWQVVRFWESLQRSHCFLVSVQPLWAAVEPDKQCFYKHVFSRFQACVLTLFQEHTMKWINKNFRGVTMQLYFPGLCSVELQ